MFLLQSVSLCPFPLQSQLSYRGGREGEMKKCHSKGEGVGQGGLGGPVLRSLPAPSGLTP